MTDEIPYECDTSRYYQPYKVNGKCLCNKNLVQIDGFCLCNEKYGFKLHQENDNCECTKQGEYQFLSSSGRSCVLCDEKNGQVKGTDGTCVCSDKYKMVSNNPLQCYKCDDDQFLKDNKCFCSSTKKEGTCQLKQGISMVQISFIVVLVCAFIIAVVLIDFKIHQIKRRREKQRKFDQINQKAVQIVPMIRRSQLII
ncbi:Hypothetical_protein [Hexamita inflata]|uniref:Hypothetical_protein n=1 Tax=Hexamita inflata TaxID=28002 RepID=A0AA86P519_9EUKA|nr:Hypothetical protein HINF_LOCUS18461 [Hexamita inflata]